MLCFRLFSESSPAAPLAASVELLRKGQAPSNLFLVEPASFKQIPNAPFAYWVSERIRRLFVELPAFEGEGRKARQGLATANDFRFVRAAWETPAEGMNAEKRWFTFAKGGSYSTYYADLYLQVNWGGDGAECKEYIIQRYPYLNGNAGFVAKNTEYYFKPGITWTTATTRNLSARVLPPGCIFSHMGPCLFVKPEAHLSTLAWMNSRPIIELVKLMLGLAAEGRKSYEVGVIQRLPWPAISDAHVDLLHGRSQRLWNIRGRWDRRELTSSSFWSTQLVPHRMVKPPTR